MSTIFVSGDDSELRLPEEDTHATPDTGLVALYAKTDGLLYAKDDAGTETALGGGGGGEPLGIIPGGRLTLTTATPVMTTDTTGTTLYYTPHLHGNVPIYSGTEWELFTFTELSITNAGLAVDTNYDVYVYDNSGTPALILSAWTNATTPADTLVRQDGIWVKSGDTGKTFVGVVRTWDNSTVPTFAWQPNGGVVNSRVARLFVWNCYHRVQGWFKVYDSTSSWVYATSTWRYEDNNANNRIDFVQRFNDRQVWLTKGTRTGGGSAYNGFGLDGTTPQTNPDISGQGIATGGFYTTTEQILLGVGYHYLAVLEYMTGASTTFYGSAGVSGFFRHSTIGYFWS